jgi:hypothetical protein
MPARAQLLRLAFSHVSVWLACVVAAIIDRSRAALWRLLEAALVVMVLTGCATKFYHNGQLVLDTQANITGLVVTKDGELRADRIDHSTPTRAGGAVAGTIITGVVSGITAYKVP